MASRSATISIASSRRSTRSVRQSCQLHRRALEVAAVLLELRLESREEGEGVGGGAGEAGQDPAVVEPPDLAAPGFTTVLPRVTWPSPASTVRPAVANGQNRRAVKHNAPIVNRRSANRQWLGVLELS